LFGTLLVHPEAGDLEFLHSRDGSNPPTSDQVKAFWDPSSSSYVGDDTSVDRLVAGHSYWSNSSIATGIENRVKLRSRLDSYDVDFWQTEYSILGGDYLEGRSEAQLKDIDYALWLTRIMHWDISIANATGWSFWTSLSYPKWADHKFRFGLLNWYPDSENRDNSSGTIEETKNLWAFGNFSRFVRPGYQRIEVENNLFSTVELQAENLMVTGYMSPDHREVVLVFVNYSSKDVDVPITNYAAEGGVRFTDDIVTTYTTDQTRNLLPKSVSIEDLNIKAKSIITVVGTINQP